MAAGMRRDLAILGALHEVDRVALGAQTALPIVQTLFQGTAALFAGDPCAVALLADSPGRPSCTLHVSSGHLGRPVRHEVPAEPEDLALLEAMGEGLKGPADQVLPRPFRSLLAPGGGEVAVVPMRPKGRVVGCLAVALRPDSDGTDHLTTLRQLAGSTALALGNVALVQELEAASLGALTALARAIDAASPWTAGHSERVTATAVEIARRLGLPPEELDRLRRGGLLHDIGKLGVPASVLDKPGRLTDEDLAVVRRHPSIGASILSPIPALHDVLPLVRSHHEMLDGSGYPDGLQGDQIPRAVRILTVADVFDALVSDRPYRPSWSAAKTLAYLREHEGTWYDGPAVEALAAAIAEGWSEGQHPPVSVPIPPASGAIRAWREQSHRSELTGAGLEAR
jgi:putative nucleotidyltransferase with HDIG domain